MWANFKQSNQENLIRKMNVYTGGQKFGDILPSFEYIDQLVFFNSLLLKAQMDLIVPFYMIFLSF